MSLARPYGQTVETSTYWQTVEGADRSQPCAIQYADCSPVGAARDLVLYAYSTAVSDSM